MKFIKGLLMISLVLLMTGCNNNTEVYTFDEYIEMNTDRIESNITVPVDNAVPNVDGDALVMEINYVEFDLDTSGFRLVDVYAFEVEDELMKSGFFDKAYKLDLDYSDIETDVKSSLDRELGEDVCGSRGCIPLGAVYHFRMTLENEHNTISFDLTKVDDVVYGNIKLDQTSNDMEYFYIEISYGLDKIYDHLYSAYVNQK